MIRILRTLARNVEAFPERPALVENGQTITWRALEERSTALALHFRTQSLGDGAVVAFVKESMTEAFVFMLAGLKAGVGFMVPDHAEDLAKLRHLLELAEVQLTFAEGSRAAKALSNIDRVPVMLDSVDWSARGALPDVSPDAMAYIEPTSGSTNLPKLVHSSQAVVDHYITLQTAASGLSSEDRIGLWGEMWIDTLFAGLAVGAELHAFDFRGKGASELSLWMRESRITAVQSYVAAFRALCEATPDPLPDLRLVRLSGEAILRRDVEAFEALCLSGAELMGYFGATECGLISQYVHRRGDPLPETALPIGTPLAGTTLEVVDPLGDVMPVGGVGALIFRTAYLPQGYLNNPEQTAAVYSTEADGTRVLRSGDLGYRDADGNFHMAGRSDDQVKIRGYSVRYSEIETTLEQVDGVAEAAVTSIVSPRGVRQLAAHIVPEPEAKVAPPEIKSELKAELPDYMVPAYVVVQNDLPRTGTGKVLRRALPNPLDVIDSKPVSAETLTPTEEAVAAVWYSILGHKGFGIDEDFFDVGGDSLQAMSVVIALEQSLKLRVGYESLIIDGASVRAIAARLDQAAADGDLVTLLEADGARPLYIMPVENGEFSDWLYLLNAFDGTRPVFGVHARPPTERDAIAYRTVEEMAEYVAEAILRHDPEGPHLIAGFSSGAQIAFEVAVALGARGYPVAGLMLVDPPVLNTEVERHSWHIRRILSPLMKQRSLRMSLDRAGHILLRRPVRELGIADETSFWRHRPVAKTVEPVLLISALDRNPYKDHKQQVWKALVGGNPEVLEVPGDHITLVREPHAPRLAKLMEGWLDRVEPNDATEPRREAKKA